MVLESLFNPFTAKKKPWEMFLAGFIYSLVGIGLSYIIFREVAGILTVFLIVMATIPMLYVTFKKEEEFDLTHTGEPRLLQEHTKVITFLLFLFLGITVALVLSYIFLPEEMVNSVFSLQHNAIKNVNENIQGYITGNIAKFDFFVRIITNNLKVLFFCLIFSLLYGTGAMFILTWNASVIATAIGSMVKTELAQTASLAGLPTLANYFGAATLGFFRYMIHGIIEIAAYFVMGLAGAILSVAIIRHNLKEERILIDALDLVLISFGLLLVAALVEVYITPLFFT